MIPAIVAVAGLALSVYSSISAGKDEDKALKARTKELRKQARAKLLESSVDSQDYLEDFEARQGSAIASIGASGALMTGSAVDIIQADAARGYRDAYRIIKQGALQAEAIRSDAAQVSFEQGAARRATNIRTAGAALQGTASVYSAFKDN